MTESERMATVQEIYLILWNINPDGNKAQEVIGFKALKTLPYILSAGTLVYYTNQSGFGRSGVKQVVNEEYFQNISMLLIPVLVQQ